jgi:hypothetical protein
MLKLQNIDKLKGVVVGGWTCYMVEEHKDNYTMLFQPQMFAPGVIVQFRLYKEDQIKGLWTLRGMLRNNNSALSGFGHNHNTTDAILFEDMKTPENFCRVLMKPLHKFNDMLRVGIPTYHTSSLATVTKRINGGGHSFGGYQIPKPPPVSHPQWYVSEETESKPKMPTMWETFKEMIKWDKWINILFPMKTAIEQMIPKKKKITAKKAAY